MVVIETAEKAFRVLIYTCARVHASDSKQASCTSQLSEFLNLLCQYFV